MKCTIPEISWHNRDPVLSVDIQYSRTNKNFYRLASGGTDAHVLIWQLTILENGGVSVESLSDLTRHTRAVNAVRFSPNGQILASSDDDAAIILWKKSEDSNDIFIDENEKENKEHWTILKMLRNHIEDVYDLCWSSCSNYLISGSVDNSAILWDVHKVTGSYLSYSIGKSKAILKDHKGFVQGVSWDPKGQYVATLSSDRFLRVFNIGNDKVKLTHRVHKSVLNSSEDPVKTTRLFYDDTLKSFCRRLSFSPDGELLVTPSAILEESEGKFTNVSHIFTRTSFSRPVLCLPTQDKYTIAVRFCPILFALRELKCPGDENGTYTQLFDLPYRMVFAVATQNSVLIYDTQQPVPFAKVSNIHYTRLSDVSWSSDGKILVVSSTDGYCSLVSFCEGELGIPYESTKEINQESPLHNNSCTNSSNGDIEKMEVVEDLIEPKNEKNVEKEVEVENENAQLKKGSIESEKEGVKIEKMDEKIKSNKEPKPIAVKRKPGKRVELVTLTKNNEKSKDNEASSSEENEKIERVDNVVSSKILQEKVPKAEDKDKNKKNNNTDSPSVSSQKTPRRVPLITLSSPRNKNLNS
ncbi:UNVERIFIED_CONTAM: hypothetical protein RMT77_005403 [Armadillidium vulgare]